MLLENQPLMGEKFLKNVHKYQQCWSTKMEESADVGDVDHKWATPKIREDL